MEFECTFYSYHCVCDAQLPSDKMIPTKILYVYSNQMCTCCNRDNFILK